MTQQLITHRKLSNCPCKDIDILKLEGDIGAVVLPPFASEHFEQAQTGHSTAEDETGPRAGFISLAEHIIADWVKQRLSVPSSRP